MCVYISIYVHTSTFSEGVNCQPPCIPQHGASQEEFFRGDLTQNLKDAVFDFASLAHTHLLKMRNLKESVPKSASRVFLPAVSVNGPDYDCVWLASLD